MVDDGCRRRPRRADAKRTNMRTRPRSRTPTFRYLGRGSRGSQPGRRGRSRQSAGPGQHCKAHAEHSDVARQQTDRPDDSPVGPEHDGLSLTHNLRRAADRHYPPASTACQEVVAEHRQRHERQEHDYADGARHQAEQRVALAWKQSQPQPESGCRQREHVDRAGEEKQDGRALGDARRVAAPFDEQQGSRGDAAGPTQRNGGAECELAQRHRAPKRIGTRLNTCRNAST